MDNAETDQGKNKMRYKVANHLFEVVLPSEANAELLLPSFTPFISKDETGPLLFLFDSTSYFSQEGGVPIEESENDMGHITIWKIEQGYRIEARHILANKRHTMVADKEFLGQFAVALAQKWVENEPVVISTEEADSLKAYFAAHAKELLDKGVTINKVNGKETLFTISPADGSYKVNFGKEEFETYFKEFLRPQMIEMLF